MSPTVSLRSSSLSRKSSSPMRNESASAILGIPSTNPARPSMWLSAMFVFLCLFAHTASGQEPTELGDAASPVEQSISDSIWFDAEQNKVVPVPVKPEVDDSVHRSSRWLPKADRVRQPSSQNAAGGTGGGGLFGTGLTIANLIGWLLLLSFVAIAVGLVLYGLSKAEIELHNGGGKLSSRRDIAPDQQTVERMKHLPAELRRTDVNLRFEAERLMNDEQYDQAIILLFGHQLLLLDHAGILRLNRGKTNRKYVRETRANDRQLAGWLQDTVTAFERSYFGRHTIGKPEFDRLWQANADLEQSIQRQGEFAA